MKKTFLAVCTVLLFVSCTKNDTPQKGQGVAGESLVPDVVSSDAEEEVQDNSSEVQEEEHDDSFTSCVFDRERDQIILSNKSGSYKLEVYLYGTYIGHGEYQVLGSEGEKQLEGTLRRDGVSCDLKTTLFIDCTEERIKVSGSAQLYEPHSVRKSDEILDFAYEGSLAVVSAEEEQESEQEPSLGSYGVTEEEYLASYADRSDDPDKPKMVFVEGGKFQLGSDRSGYHDVTVSSFEIGMTEVTIGQYYTALEKPIPNENAKNYPACMNWFEAVIYCNKLSEAHGYEPCYSINGETDPALWDNEVPHYTEAKGHEVDMTIWDTVRCDFNANGYRLPTLAEWTFAAQGGNKSLHTTYSGSNNIEDIGWIKDNAKKKQEVATKKSNELGIYDMTGNVWEWCWNWNASYENNAEINPTGPENGNGYRIRCGGGWDSPSSESKIRWHLSEFPDVDSYIGMRLCRSIGQR